MDPASGDPYAVIVECLKYWSILSVDVLDQNAQKIGVYVDESVVERKKLAEETKRWNTLSDEEKIVQVKPLLKLYQKEVDRLTSRAKFSEQAYMGVYGQVTKAPDHGAALEKADEWIERTRRYAKLEIENQKLNRELEEFRRDFDEIRNQEVTVRRLEDQIRRYEEDMERTIEQRISEAERRMNDEMAAKVIIQREREDELLQQTQKALEEAKLAQQNLEVAQNQKSATETRLEAELQAKQASIDMLTNDLDRMATVVATLEKEVMTLSSNESQTSTASSNAAELEMQVVQKDIRLSELTKQVEDLQLQLSTQTSNLEERLEEATNRADSAQTKIEELQKHMQALPTVEEYNKLKSRLQILRVLDIDVDDTSPSSADITAESVLRDRARKLESENVKLRSNIVDLEDRVNRMTSELSSLQAQDRKKDATIQRLEEDLQQQITAAKTSAAAAAAVAADSAVADSATSSSSSSSLEGADSLLSIVTGQRDRFRSRVSTLEEENRSLMDQLKMAKVELRSVGDDNLKLYQRIKYLQSYGELSKGRVDLETGVSSSSSSSEVVEDKYKQIYETSVDPFAAFSRSERSKRMQGLNPAERLILDTSSFFLANRTTRMILFGYMLVLHLLVFLTTWRLAHTTQNCPDYPRETVADLTRAAEQGNNN
eukprot:TRINITY_DN15047_c0_g1_i1.p1 TRINITY_DN15047_c0_g1~~TRINITY_DN15047_c0_g1_i1.p1  ORF type:complete len:689 (+),score=154.33 TRINITY_DN15047_c0_g1_i1:91-2067(+)